MNLLLTRPLMGQKRGGRPRKVEGSRPTDSARMARDLVEMLSDLALIGYPRDSAEILDPLVRPELTRIHEMHKPEIEKAKALLAAHAEEMARIAERVEEKATEPPLPAPPTPTPPRPPKKPKRE